MSLAIIWSLFHQSPIAVVTDKYFTVENALELLLQRYNKLHTDWREITPRNNGTLDSSSSLYDILPRNYDYGME